MALTKIGSIGINTGIQFAGVTTIATLNASDNVLSVGDTVNFVSDVSIGGTVSIAGTLTYEDVTNVDAVGLITARNGIKVGSGITLSPDGNIFTTGITTIGTGLSMADSVPASFGDSGDLKISHNGTDSLVQDLGTGNLKLSSNGAAVILEKSDAEPMVRAYTDGAVELYHDNSKKLETANGGVTVTGTLTATSGSAGDGTVTLLDLNHGGNDTNDAAKLNFSRAGSAIGSISLEKVAANNTTDFIINTRSFNTVSETLRITGAGKATFTTPGGDDAFLVKGDNYTSVRIQSARDSASDHAMFQMLGSRGTNASPTIVQSGDILGTLSARGYDGNSYASSSNINFGVDGTPGDGDMPGRITFSTAADGSESTTEKLRIVSTGELLVNTTTTSPHIRLNEKLGIVHVGNYGGASFTNYGGTTAAHKPLLDFNRSRGTSDGSMTAVAAGDGLGHIVFRGADGTNFIDGAAIRADVDDYNSASPGTGDMPGRLVFETTPDGSTTLTERLRITHTGAFYIKAPSAIYPGAQPGEIQWWNENGAGVMAKIGVNREDGTYAPSGLDFYVNTNVDSSANNSQGDITARMRINSKGHTAIITTADAAATSHGYSDRGGALYVKNGQNGGVAGGGAVLAENTYANHSYGACIQCYIATAGQDRSGILFSSANSTSGNKDWMIGNLNGGDDFRINYGSGRYASTWGSTYFRIDTSGTFHGSSSNNISDIRIKENIVTIQDPIEKIKNLRGVTFEWQKRTKFKEGVNYGFIAQEVNEVVPELVNKEEGLCGFDENGDIVPIVHDEGSEKRKHVDVSWGVTTDGIVSILVEAVKKLSAKNDALEARITALEE